MAVWSSGIIPIWEHTGREIESGQHMYVNVDPPSWGRCYDHNFLRFLTISCDKIGVFLKNQCYDQNIA
jgi:hypothetical protein